MLWYCHSGTYLLEFIVSWLGFRCFTAVPLQEDLLNLKYCLFGRKQLVIKSTYRRIQPYILLWLSPSFYVSGWNTLEFWYCSGKNAAAGMRLRQKGITVRIIKLKSMTISRTYTSGRARLSISPNPGPKCDFLNHYRNDRVKRSSVPVMMTRLVLDKVMQTSHSEVNNKYNVPNQILRKGKRDIFNVLKMRSCHCVENCRLQHTLLGKER
jgi:hypothetical protein